MSTGRVKFYNGTKGYGFVLPDDGGQDVFIHVKDLRQTGLVSLNEGQAVKFEVEPGRDGKGPKAVNVELVA